VNEERTESQNNATNNTKKRLLTLAVQIMLQIPSKMMLLLLLKNSGISNPQIFFT
jgi:hypothetical protein